MAVRLYHCSNTSVTVSGQTLVAGTRALRGGIPAVVSQLPLGQVC